ncbi:nucleotidyltransferase family protein [Streptomyces sp. NPDC049687]|uniref:nucleotidyltransferase family protein n=1 Tax=Streptomyces sp. NPDC049687 TaxID=3365596 RepID=UPI0037A9DA4A
MPQHADDQALDQQAGVAELRLATGDRGSGPPHEGVAEGLPVDRNQAILEAAKQVGSILKREGHAFALAGSVAVYAHGGSENLQHDVDFCFRPEDAQAVADSLRAAGLSVYTPPEDWLLKTDCFGQQVDLIFQLAHQPVTTELLERARPLPVDSVFMPVLSPTDLVHSLVAAFSEHHCDFGAVLPIARTLREKVDWDALRRACGSDPMPDAFFYFLERLDVIPPGPSHKPEEAP